MGVQSLQLCLTLCDPMDCSLPGSPFREDSPGKNTGVGCHALLQGPSQPRDSTCASCDSCITGGFFTVKPPGKPKNTRVGSLSLSQGIFPSQESNRGLLHCRWILYHLSYERSPLGVGVCVIYHRLPLWILTHALV